MQLRGEAQDVINDGLYKQCRGEWKLARAVSVGCINEEGAAVMQPLLYKDDLISRDYFFQA